YLEKAVRLADFIEGNIEPILADWVRFAESSGPAGRIMDLKGLRDHASQMLHEIVTDLRTPQTAAQQTEKSKGKADSSESGDTAAEVHGSGRAESGFSVGEMVSEYRALRASVIRLWTKAKGSLTGADLDDLMRFNEAIDQSLAESISRYTQDIDRSREMFVAILGHELRSPLSVVITGSQFMLDRGALTEPDLTVATRVARTAGRMNQMVADLLDFTWGRLGSGIPITPGETDLAVVIRQAVDEMAAVHTDAVLQFTPTGNLTGQWDAPRISQVVTNLLGNAVQHGTSGTRISVTAQGESADVVLRVHSQGQPIPKADLPGLFSPFKRFQSDRPAARDSGNLGLGLYITERIVSAHNGTIDVRSSAEAGTLFTIRLPR
ncbi:MAG TPA: sensor histidine kinase, partial [Gemmatimonadaceae bacterium]|nr:sensor histidine kinase [Gemmatimonadaceae bacterium]